MSIFDNLTELLGTTPSLVELVGKAVEVVGEVIDSDTVKEIGQTIQENSDLLAK
jgi:hypothetical protein